MGRLLRACVQAACLTLATGGASCSPTATSGPSEEGPPAPPEERRTVHVVAMEGGQSGMEGGCPGNAEPPSLNFSLEDVRALIEGPFDTTLAFGSASAWPDGTASTSTREMTVSARLVGEPETDRRCGAQMRVDAEVTLAFKKPALDVIIALRLSAASSQLAVAEFKIEPSLVAAMELPGVEVPEAASSFLLQFSARGPQGTIWLKRSCGVEPIRFPSESRCEPGNPELEPTRPLYGVRPKDVMQSCVDKLSELGAMPVQWSDGATTTLSVSIEEEPRSACGGNDALAQTGQSAFFHSPLRVQLKTSDGKLDLSMPAGFVWRVSPEGGLDPSATPGWDGYCSLDAGGHVQTATVRDARALPETVRASRGTVRVELSVSAALGGEPMARVSFLEWESICGDAQPKRLVGLKTENFPL